MGVVDQATAARATAALSVLADLSPAMARRERALSVPLDWFAWLPRGVGMFTPLARLGIREERDAAEERLLQELLNVQIDRSLGERLAALQQLREGRHPVRIGWLWVAGTTTVTAGDGREVSRRVFHPLVSRTVRVQRGLVGARLEAYGDPEITPLVTDRAMARDLEERIEVGGGAIDPFDALDQRLLDRLTHLRAFAADCAAAAGFQAGPLVAERPAPQQAMRAAGLQVIAGVGVYTNDEPERASRAGGLLAWHAHVRDAVTAFHSVYAGLDVMPGSAGEDRVLSPLPLTPRQAEAVRAARGRMVTVVSGAPGTGKSHTLVSIVCDALARGESVLVAAKHDAAVDALLALLERQPGVTPVVFGSARQRAELAASLASGQLQPVPEAMVEDAARALEAAVAARDEALETARRSLTPEWHASGAGAAVIDAARAVAPAAFSVSAADLAVVVGLVAQATPTRRGWRAARRARRSARAVRSAVGADREVAFDVVAEAVRTAARRHGEHSVTPAAACSALRDAEREVSRRLTSWLALETRSARRLDRRGLEAIAALATALRSGRSARRAQLERLAGRSLTSALPVWLGTLGDVDDLLPPVPAMFDLVLVDEASSTEQATAAAALLRARRAVVVGDPRQLRHVSFVADATIEEVLERHDVELTRRAQLDVRRNSLFDAAAAASPVVMLDEHFRSSPHLIDVVARTVYGGNLLIATRNPLTHSVDCVHLQPVAGRRDEAGVVVAEVDAVMSALRGLAAHGRSVGVVTPFRAQADAVEATALGQLGADEIERLQLRVGTVHAFQGNERDIVLCSLGLDDEESAGWTFVRDPHLLAVMLTRARERMVVMSSCRADPGSLLGRYVAAADRPPGPPPPAAELRGWPRSVLDDLRLAGVVAWESYPTGRHVVDIAAVRGHTPIAVICQLHPAGIDAHIDRHVALIESGWQVLDALSTLWEGEEAERLADLSRRLLPARR